ncbi:hypothetical protein KW787_00505 [Candidatus Pacearchaeota archaeon]|nr:hypothetical protein [Candidatus Pacearchaeota archaeon]
MRGQVDSQLAGFIFIFVCLLIIGGVVAGNTIALGDDFNYKPLDAAILNAQVQKCLSLHDISKISSDFYATCGINESIIKKYYRIKICDTVECIGSKGIFSTEGDFEICGITGINKNSNYPSCSTSQILISSKKYTIITVSSQDVRRGL